MFNHDVFYGACDAYDLLILLVGLRSNWLYATSKLLPYNSTRLAACIVSVMVMIS